MEVAPRADRRQSGQALTETLVFSLVGVGLLFAVLLIGRLHAIQASAIGAARALAFDCRLDSAACGDPVRVAQLSAEIRARHFIGPADTEASNTPPLTSTQRPVVPHPFWTHPNGARMVDSVESVSLSSTPLSLDAGVNVAASFQRLADAGDLLAIPAGPQRFGLDPSGGFRAARVEVPVLQSPTGPGAWVFPVPSGLRLRARLAIVGDEWNASQSSGADLNSVQARVEQGSRLDPFRESALDAGYAVTRGMMRVADSMGLEPGAAALPAHRLDVTIIPKDRRP